MVNVLVSSAVDRGFEPWSNVLVSSAVDHGFEPWSNMLVSSAVDRGFEPWSNVLVSSAVDHGFEPWSNVLVSSVVDRGFEPWSNVLVWSGQTKDYNVSICCFSDKHTALSRKSKDWLVRNQDNVSEWGDMSIHRLLFQWAITIKIQLRVLD